MKLKTGSIKNKIKELNQVDKNILKLHRQEKLMTIAVVSFIVIATISIMLIIFVLLMNK